MYERLTVNLVGRVRRVTWNGRRYLVAPLTSIVPGVLAGSKGPLYYPPNEIARNVGDWNGIPLVVYHPFHPITNEHLSARSPGVIQRQGIGTIRNSVYRGKLCHEGWFDEEKTKQVDERVLNALLSGQPLELSTGLYTDNEPAPNGSTHNGRPYEFIARNYKPDHLAILPDQTGACSLQDGCGVLVNQEPMPSPVSPVSGSTQTNPATITKSGKPKKPKEPKLGPAVASGSAEAASRQQEHRTITSTRPIANCDCTSCQAARTENGGPGSGPHKGSVSRAGTPAARPESGQWAQGSTVVPGKGKQEEPSKRVKKSSKVVEDHPEASRIADESHARHKERIKGATEPEQVQSSYAQHEKELDEAGIVPTNTGYGFRKGREPTGNDANFRSEAQRRYLWSQEPDIAESWAHGEHTADDDHKMPEETGEDVHVKGKKTENAQTLVVNQMNPTLLERFLNLFSPTVNADQPRHPANGTFQGKHSVAAKVGYDSHKNDYKEDVALVGKPNPKGDDGRNVDKVTREGDLLNLPIDDHSPTRVMNREALDTYNTVCALLNAKPETNQVYNIEAELAYNQAWPQERKDKLPESDFAGLSQTFPIENQQDLDWAIALLSRADNQEQVRNKLINIANRKKLSLPTGFTGNAFPPVQPQAQSPSPASPIGGPPPMVTPDSAHQFSKQAAGASLQTEHGKSFGHAQGAMSQSSQGNSEEAMDMHQKAASTHEKAATKAMKDGDQGSSDNHLAAAALHRKAAAMHAAVNNQGNDMFTTNMPAGGAFRGAQDAGYSAEQAAAMAGKLEGSYEGGGADSGASKEARSASKEAERTGSSRAHKAAASAHREAAAYHKSEGNTEHAEAHMKSAKSHERSAKAAARNQQIVNELVANGHLNSAVAQQVLQTLNTPDEMGSGTLDSSVQAGGEEDDEDADDSTPGQKVKIKAKGNKTMNQSRLLANATPEERDWIERNLQREQREKFQLIANLTNHLQGQAKQRMVANLGSKTLQEIEELSLLRGVPTENQNQGQNGFHLPTPVLPIYLGRGGVPITENTGEGVTNADNDVSDMTPPTINWGGKKRITSHEMDQ